MERKASIQKNYQRYMKVSTPESNVNKLRTVCTGTLVKICLHLWSALEVYFNLVDLLLIRGEHTSGTLIHFRSSNRNAKLPDSVTYYKTDIGSSQEDPV